VALRKGNQMKLQTTWSPSSHTDGRVPWMHSGPRTCTKKAYPECYGAPGDDRSVEETFRPHLFGSKAARVRAPTLLCCVCIGVTRDRLLSLLSCSFSLWQAGTR
jgi:hypothetical protein